MCRVQVAILYRWDKIVHGVNDHKPYAQVFILHCMHRHIVQASSGHMYALVKVLNNLTGSGMCASP